MVRDFVSVNFRLVSATIAASVFGIGLPAYLMAVIIEQSGERWAVSLVYPILFTGIFLMGLQQRKKDFNQEDTFAIRLQNSLD